MEEGDEVLIARAPDQPADVLSWTDRLRRLHAEGPKLEGRAVDLVRELSAAVPRPR